MMLNFPRPQIPNVNPQPSADQGTGTCLDLLHESQLLQLPSLVGLDFMSGTETLVLAVNISYALA